MTHLSEKQQLCRDFWAGLIKRAEGKTDLFQDMSPWEGQEMRAGHDTGRSIYRCRIQRETVKVVFILDAKKTTNPKAANKKNFTWVEERRAAIERAFGERLQWDRQGAKDQCKMSKTLEGGYANSREEWPSIQDAMIDAMIRLEKAFRPYLAKLAERT